MFWRLANKNFDANGPANNRTALQELATEGKRAVGLLGYADGEPIGWCSVGPPPDYARVARTKAFKPFASRTWAPGVLID
jgi:hypothetical protein